MVPFGQGRGQFRSGFRHPDKSVARARFAHTALQCQQRRSGFFPTYSVLLIIFESSNVSSMKTELLVQLINPLEAKAEEVASTLAAMANPKRLLVMCTLLDGEKSVGDLAVIVELSPAALSQHLGKMRALRLVSTRRDGQTIYYSLASKEVRAILETLYRVFCNPNGDALGTPLADPS